MSQEQQNPVQQQYGHGQPQQYGYGQPQPPQPQPQQQGAETAQYQGQGGFWSRPAATLTANDVRRVVRHGVAEGVLIAGLFLFFVSFVAGLAGLSCVGQSPQRSSPYSSR